MRKKCSLSFESEATLKLSTGANSLKCASIGPGGGSFKGPTSSLLRSPYLRVRLQCRNLKLYSNKLCKVWLRTQVSNVSKETKILGNVTSPIWHSWIEYKFTGQNTYMGGRGSTGNLHDPDPVVQESPGKLAIILEVVALIADFKEETVLGYQIIPLNYLERRGLIGQRCMIWLTLCQKEDIEVDLRAISRFHNPENFVITTEEADRANSECDPPFEVPIIGVEMEYFDEESLYMMAISMLGFKVVHEQKSGKNMYTAYKMLVRRKDGLEWVKYLRYSHVRNLRNLLLKEFPEIKIIPFPEKNYSTWMSMFSKKHSNYDQEFLSDRQHKLHEFLSELCKIQKIYHNIYFIETLSK